ncbi:MAG TPA: hypothetical protein VL633_12760 [Bacteroidota bacterium]|jgi:hypothetical protein|nr:hypothetical protein [Bacteroidota bacterium]
MQNTSPSTDRRKLSPLKIVWYAGVAVGGIAILCVLMFLCFPNPIVNKFIKPRMLKSFADAHPGYSLRTGDMNYNVWKNRLGCDSLTLKTDGVTCSMASVSVKGIDWMKILRQTDVPSDPFMSSEMFANDIVINFHQSQSVLRLGMVYISWPDSEMEVDSIKYSSLLRDEELFAQSRFRQTRFRIDIPQIELQGFDYFALLQGNIYTARTITVHNMAADILVNRDKPADKNSPHPQMPNEALSSMKEIIAVDSLKIINGRMTYCERYAVNAKPAVLAFDNIAITASGIANHTAFPETATVHGEGVLQNSGTVRLFMKIPLTSKDFSFQYSGSLSTMDATALNSFIEHSDYQRIKSGIVQSAAFNVSVTSGHAQGTLKLTYQDLSISILNKETGSENGIFNRISSLIGKIFVIRGSNMPDNKGQMKVGVVSYTRKPGDYFFQFLWFALRNSIADIVGFPPIIPE